MDRHYGAHLAVIKNAMKAEQSLVDTWPRISPAEAKAVRDSYYAAEEKIEVLTAWVKELEDALIVKAEGR